MKLIKTFFTMTAFLLTFATVSQSISEEDIVKNNPCHGSSGSSQYKCSERKIDKLNIELEKAYESALQTIAENASFRLGKESPYIGGGQKIWLKYVEAHS